jgi:hypothetical protein
LFPEWVEVRVTYRVTVPSHSTSYDVGGVRRRKTHDQRLTVHLDPGEELLSRYHSSEFVVKHFCSVCGSNLISTYDDDPAKVGVPLGGLDQAPSNAPEGHFFVGSKAPWFTITD